MNTDEAIEILECIYPSEKEIKTGEYPDVAEALDMAINALRERKAQEKGCVFCKHGHHIKEAFNDGKACIISGDFYYALAVETEREETIFSISYCPICGCELKKEDKQ